MSDAAKKQCEILDEAQRRFGHQVSQWRAAGESVLNEPISSALDRASVPAMFNVVGDELRKLAKSLKDIELGVFSDEGILRDSFRAVTRHLLSFEERMKIQHDITHVRLTRIEPQANRDYLDTIARLDIIESQLSTFKDGTYERINLLATDNEKMQAQLTALRAEADKGRAALEQKIDALDMALETQGLQQDVIEKKLDEQFVPSETFDEWWQCVGHTHMPKRDQPPEHASIARTAWNAALRSVRKPSAARKKKQERKRRGARKSR